MSRGKTEEAELLRRWYGQPGKLGPGELIFVVVLHVRGDASLEEITRSGLIAFEQAHFADEVIDYLQRISPRYSR